jgi:AcrR family transcriptional regulator
LITMDNNSNDHVLHSNQSASDDNLGKGKRRRGKVLEDAILEAAWEELCDVGYNRLTMEGVATRAKTNKAVVYRRWANKPTLVVSVLRKFVPPLLPKEVPDTGNLRNDVFSFLHGIAKPIQIIGTETIRGLMVEYIGIDKILSIPQIMHPKNEGKLTTAMIAILKNAEMRGEIKFEKISPRVITLPIDLLRYELLTTYEPVSDKAISEIVDDIFMPLIHYYSQS